MMQTKITNCFLGIVAFVFLTLTINHFSLQWSGSIGYRAKVKDQYEKTFNLYDNIFDTSRNYKTEQRIVLYFEDQCYHYLTGDNRHELANTTYKIGTVHRVMPETFLTSPCIFISDAYYYKLFTKALWLSTPISSLLAILIILCKYSGFSNAFIVRMFTIIAGLLIFCIYQFKNRH